MKGRFLQASFFCCMKGDEESVKRIQKRKKCFLNPFFSFLKTISPNRIPLKTDSDAFEMAYRLSFCNLFKTCFVFRTVLCNRVFRHVVHRL